MFVITALKRRRRRRKLKKKEQQNKSRSQLPSVRITSRTASPPANSSNNNTNNNNTNNNNASSSARTSPSLGNANDLDQKMPFLYSLARSWAWDAVSYRCRTHPSEAAAVDYLGDTALHWAAFGSAPLSAVAALLATYPEAARLRNRSGQTPLHVACSYRASSQVIEALRAAHPDAVNLAMHSHNSGATPLHCLCDYGGSSNSGGGSSVIVGVHHAAAAAAQRATPEFDSVRALRLLLAGGETADPATGGAAGILPQSLFVRDQLYQRRPLEILNARKNIYQEQRDFETLQNLRDRQRALRRELIETEQEEENRKEATTTSESTKSTTESKKCDQNNKDKEQDGAYSWSQLQRELLERWEDDIRMYRYSEFWQKASLLMVAEYQLYRYQEAVAAANDDDADADADAAVALPPPRLPACMMQIEQHHQQQQQQQQEQHTAGDTSLEDERCVKILHAAVGNPHCPLSLQQYALLLYEPFLLVPDPGNFDRLPLHVAAALQYNSGTSDEAGRQLLHQLVRACPEAARVRDRNGQFPLQSALQPPPQRQQTANPNANAETAAKTQSRSVWSPGLSALIDANPTVLLEEQIGLLNDAAPHDPEEEHREDEWQQETGERHDGDDDDEEEDQEEDVVDNNNNNTSGDVETDTGDDDEIPAQPCLYPHVFARLSQKALFPLLQANPALLTRFTDRHATEEASHAV